MPKKNRSVAQKAVLQKAREKRKRISSPTTAAAAADADGATESATYSATTLYKYKMSTDGYSYSKFWSFKSIRFVLTLLFLLAVLASAFVKNTLSMAMVCMGTYNWGHYEQGFLFSMYFLGGLITSLPAGWLSDRYNPKMLVATANLIETLGCILTPVTTKYGGFIGLAALRFIMGIFGPALLFPGISAISARWIPPTERSTVMGIYTAGNEISNVIGMPLNAALCASGFLGGWPSIFYVSGTFGIISLVLWLIFSSNRPESNRFVSDKEKTYISLTLASQNLGNRKAATKHVPWQSILSSPAVLTCMFSYFGMCIMTTTLASYIPTYYKNVLGMGLMSDGFFSALPYVFQTAGKISFGVIGDKMKTKTNVSHIITCKIFNSISCFGVAGFLVACSYMNCSTSSWAVTFLCLTNLCLTANVPGFQTSILSIAPAYTGIITALGRFSGLLASVIAPLIVAGLTPNQTAGEWQNVFFVISALMFLCGILFLLFGSVSIQEWAKLPKYCEKDKDTFNHQTKNNVIISEKY